MMLRGYYYSVFGITIFCTVACTLIQITGLPVANDAVYHLSPGHTVQINNEHGAGNYLLGEQDPGKIIKHTQIHEKVLLKPAGDLHVTDVYSLSPLCHTLYIIGHNYSPILFKRINETNKANKLINTAILSNGVKPRGFFKKGYGYGYNYVYNQAKSKHGTPPIRAS